MSMLTRFRLECDSARRRGSADGFGPVDVEIDAQSDRAAVRIFRAVYEVSRPSVIPVRLAPMARRSSRPAARE